MYCSIICDSKKFVVSCVDWLDYEIVVFYSYLTSYVEEY